MVEKYILTLFFCTFLLARTYGQSEPDTIGLDYGLFIPLSEDVGTFVAIPWLGLTIPFGKKSSKK